MIKVVYYVLFGCIALLGVYYVGSSLFGRLTLWDTPQWIAKIMLLIATGLAAWLLRRAYQLGDVENRWWLGIAFVILALVAFQGVLLLTALLFGRK